MTSLRIQHFIFPLVALLAMSCTAVTDFDRFGGPDGSVPVDTGPCDDPMAVEACNGADDDCDGMVDEDFDLDTDPENCGGCSATCGTSVANGAAGCVGGSCTPSCNPGFGNCDSTYATGCETDLTDPENCSGCGMACADTEVCTATGCASDCPGSEEVCSRSCVDLSASLTHCGFCGNACDTPPNAVAVCGAGACAFVCEPGFDDCDGEPSNGCETDLTTITDCGACGTTCSYPNGTPACTAGACALDSCDAGFDNCDSDLATGCESDLTSTSTCTACGMVCADADNATGTCTATGCELVCDAGFENCDGDAATGCESDLNTSATCGSCTTSCSGGTPLCESGACVVGCMAPTPTRCGTSCVDTDIDASHCGVCDMVCATVAHATPTCAAGGCGFACDVGWEDCNGVASDGCETDTHTLTDCGACGVACTITNGTGACGTGTCTVSSCTTGFDNCDGIDSNGCETDTTTITDCGGCGTVCAVANGVPGCTGTACTIASCDVGFDDCDATYSTGCEEPLSTYFLDDDGDTYGLSTATMSFCAAAVPAAYVGIDGDCDDMDPFAYPGATEFCDGVDTDCSGVLDDGFGVGAACTCLPGAIAGAMYCDTTTSTACMYPPEGCNGVDDDCDGLIDETSSCTAGSTRSCATSCDVGGATSGTQVCGASCAWSACVPPAETCNLADDDCDGLVDEGLLSDLASIRFAGGGAPIGRRVEIAYQPVRRTFGVVYEDGGLQFAELSGDLTTVLYQGTLDPGFVRQPNIVALNGSDHFFVTYYESTIGQLAYAFIDASNAAFPNNVPSPTPTIVHGMDVDPTTDEVVLAHADSSTAYVTFFSASGATRTVSTRGRELAVGSIEDIDLVYIRSGGSGSTFAVILGERGIAGTEGAVTVRRINDSGTVQRTQPVLPTGYTWNDGGNHRSTFIEAFQGASIAEDRVVALFYDTNSGGSQGSHHVVLDGDLTPMASAEWSRSVLTFGMAMSADSMTYANTRHNTLGMFSFDQTSVPPSLTAGAGSGAGMIGGLFGNFRFVHAAINTPAPEIIVTGFGCLP